MATEFEIANCSFHEFTLDVQVRVDKLVAAAVAAERERWHSLAGHAATTIDRLAFALEESRGSSEAEALRVADSLRAASGPNA